MKASLVTSAALHGLVIFWALFSLSGPRTLDVADVEALPVDIVPVESITQMQKGDKKAPVAKVSAPKPTIRPDPVDNAQEVGNNSVDLKASKAKKDSPKQVEAAAPPKSETPSPKIDDQAAKTEPQPEPKPEPKPEPPTKVASLPKPAEESVPKPAPAEQPAEPTAETPQPAPSEAPKFASLPDAGPTPSMRPQPPAPKAADKPEPKQPEQPKKTEQKQPDQPEQPKKTEQKQPDQPKKAEKAPDDIAKTIKQASSAKKNDFDADKIAALLNREDAAGGGAKRSTQQAALGGDRTTPGEKLTQSEMDALRAQIQKNWNIIPGMADGQDVRIQVTMRLDPSGAIVGNPQITATGGSDEARRTLSGSAMRAVLMASPFQGLPPDKYAAWSEVVVNFDPSQLQMY